MSAIHAFGRLLYFTIVTLQSFWFDLTLFTKKKKISLSLSPLRLVKSFIHVRTEVDPEHIYIYK